MTQLHDVSVNLIVASALEACRADQELALRANPVQLVKCLCYCTVIAASYSYSCCIQSTGPVRALTKVVLFSPYFHNAATENHGICMRSLLLVYSIRY